MTELSIELVSRNAASLEADLAVVRERFPAVDTINVPDRLRFPLWIWEACAQARREPRLHADPGGPRRVARRHPVSGGG